jgi:hemolysin activation/secretion protein
LLGGANDLRGYYRDRFAGEESLLGSAELRLYLGALDIFVPETYGLLFFSDAGRVYIDNDFSSAWHVSFGGGLWIAPISKDHTISFTIAHSPESTLVYLSSGFTF